MTTRKATVDSSTSVRLGRNDTSYIDVYFAASRQGEDAGQGDANPGGAVVEFVEQLVEGFLEQIGDETDLSLLRARNERRIRGVDGELVGAEELG